MPLVLSLPLSLVLPFHILYCTSTAFGAAGIVHVCSAAAALDSREIYMPVRAELAKGIDWKNTVGVYELIYSVSARQKDFILRILIDIHTRRIRYTCSSWSLKLGQRHGLIEISSPARIIL